MSNNATPERPVPPRPVYETLPAAVSCALASNTQLGEMNLTRWSVTYGCSEEAIRNEFERQQWLSTQQPVTFEGGDK